MPLSHFRVLLIIPDDHLKSNISDIIYRNLPDVELLICRDFEVAARELERGLTFAVFYPETQEEVQELILLNGFRIASCDGVCCRMSAILPNELSDQEEYLKAWDFRQVLSRPFNFFDLEEWVAELVG